jgi:hypothetical protein
MTTQPEPPISGYAVFDSSAAILATPTVSRPPPLTNASRSAPNPSVRTARPGFGE